MLTCMLTWIRNVIVRFLRTAKGRCPTEEFLDGLPPSDARKVLWVLRLIERVDRVPATYLKKLTATEEIWEIRVRGAGQSYRVLCFRLAEVLWVMSGFPKKSRRIPVGQIERAKRMRREFTERQRS
jgi:phage-related protein